MQSVTADLTQPRSVLCHRGQGSQLGVIVAACRDDQRSPTHRISSAVLCSASVFFSLLRGKRVDSSASAAGTGQRIARSCGASLWSHWAWWRGCSGSHQECLHGPSCRLMRRPRAEPRPLPGTTVKSMTRICDAPMGARRKMQRVPTRKAVPCRRRPAGFPACSCEDCRRRPTAGPLKDVIARAKQWFQERWEARKRDEDERKR